MSGLAAAELRRLLPGFAGPRALSATGRRSRPAPRPAVRLRPDDDARIRVLVLAGGGIVEARLQELAAAAERAGLSELASPGTAAVTPVVLKRPRLAPPRIRGTGARVAALRLALAEYAANEADAIALARVMGAAAERLAAAQQTGSHGGVAQALRDAALVAPALGDVVALRPALRRRLAAALAGADTAPASGAVARRRVLESLRGLRSSQGLTATEIDTLTVALAGIPAGRGVTAPLSSGVRDPALDRRDRALSAGLQQLANRL